MAHCVEDFTARPQQQRMAELVEQAMAHMDNLVVEAGTGVGKTFAYLVPALLSGGKVIISTGTKHLQDQLYHKDLPVIREALQVPVKTALLKGRANYLCLYRFENLLESGAKAAHTRELSRIRDWAGTTYRGDCAELSDIPEDASVWTHITSTADSCLGAECPVYTQCFVVKARRAAQEADVVVINHHLFFADLALKEEGFGELLPSANAFILDEAHQLPEIASSFFGINLGSRQLQDLAQDTIAEQLSEAPDMVGLRDMADSLIARTMELRLVMGEGQQRGPWPPLRNHSTVELALDKVGLCLDELREALELAADRGIVLLCPKPVPLWGDYAMAAMDHAVDPPP